jgi:hypothetical protein
MNSQIDPQTGFDHFYLSAIDVIIINANKKGAVSDPLKAQRLLLDFERKILLSIYGDIINGDAINSIFDEAIVNSDKRFIAICLLRLWSSNERIFDHDRSYMHKVIKMFDVIFDNSLYKIKALSIKTSDQNFEKINKLKDFIKVQEEKFVEIQNYNLDSIGSIEGFKKLFLSILRGSELKTIIPYFLPKDISSSIDNIFNKIKDYTSATPDDKINCFSLLIQDLDRVTDADNFQSTYYYKILIVDVFDKIKNIVNKDFYNSPFSKPADLNIIPINKKYPFSQTEYEFKLGLILSNSGKGHAFDIQITVEDISGHAQIELDKYIGHIKFEDHLVEFKCKMQTPAKDMLILVQVSWANFDRNQQLLKCDFLLDGQRDDINWNQLKYTDFYSTEAVESEDELVGRREILTSLITRIEGKRVSSSFIYGQRRVGKSSIVKTLKTELEKSAPTENIVFYQETGDYIDPNPNTTINQLATNICNYIKNFDNRLTHVPIPEFRGALSPISGYLEQVSRILPTSRILIILDEFDKIPVELYRKGEIGDSFFDTIRAISNKGPYGFLLVGGERMEYIMRDQSQEMNKFKSIRVDYFDRKTHWTDFMELIIKPIHRNFEVTEEAINHLYEFTAGNPFFTKVVCEELLGLMIARKDNHITKMDMEEAKIKAVDNAGEQIFAHFWKDGIRDFIVNEEEVSLNRRKLLIALTIVSILGKELTNINVIDQCVKMSLQESVAIATLKEFIDRDVLIDDCGKIDFKVIFFKDWLLAGGNEKLRTTLVESDRLDQELMSNKLAEVKAEELVALTKDWVPYRGQEITTDKIRIWLEQFGENKNQRLMFKILQNIHFYTDFEIKTKMSQLFNLVKKSFVEAGTIRTIVGREFKRKDIIVSYLEDTPAKSGSEYAKLFADENNIFFKNIVAPDKLDRYLDTNKNINAVLFIDDFIGSGSSALDNIIRLAETYPRVFLNGELSFHYGVVCGFQEAKHKILQRMKRLKINLSIHMCDILDESDKIFDDSSKLFTAPSERYAAKAICYYRGAILEKNYPLGYSNSQSLIVFPKTIPNNSLPILWSENKDWKALFPRPL